MQFYPQSFPNQASTAAVSQHSTPIAHSLQNPGNSRFYLHLSALDAAVDAPPPSSGISRSSSSHRSLYQDFSAETALATSISSATKSSNSSVLGASASHGHLGVAPTPQVIADGSPKKSASSAALLTGVEVEANDSSSTLVSKDATLGDEMARSMPRSKPVDVPVFHLNGPEGVVFLIIFIKFGITMLCCLHLTSTSIKPVKESQWLVAPVLKVRHLHSCYPFLQISLIHFNKEHQLV